MTSLELHMTGHYDALGAALAVALVAVTAVVAIAVHYDRLIRGHRETYRARADAQRQQVRAAALMPSRRISPELAAAHAERITRHESRTWLEEALGDLTMDGPASHRLTERPVWTEGGRD